MDKIAIELARLNKTMAEILHLIQKEMKRSEELSKQYEKEKQTHTAVNNCGEALQYVEKQTDEICLAAVKQIPCL